MKTPQADTSASLTRVQNALMQSCVTGSHHDALESYQKAVSLSPSRLIHRVELGRTLHRLGKKEQARLELEVCLADLLNNCSVCVYQDFAF